MVGEKDIGVSKIIACALSKVIALNLLFLIFGICSVLLFFIAFSMIIPLIAIADTKNERQLLLSKICKSDN